MEHLQYQSERLLFRTHRGRSLVVRQVTPEDTIALADMLARLSDRTRWLRYMTPRPLSGQAALDEAARMARGRTPDHTTLVALADQRGVGEVVAAAELARDPRDPRAGELAVVVRDDEQACGIGGMLARQVVRIAQGAGITTLRAEVLAENRAMLRLLGRLGVPYATTFEHGEAQVVLTLPAEAMVELPAPRERVALRIYT
jgi:RimJ/RimL family protein N-acetyltransferase